MIGARARFHVLATAAVLALGFATMLGVSSARAQDAGVPGPMDVDAGTGPAVDEGVPPVPPAPQELLPPPPDVVPVAPPGYQVRVEQQRDTEAYLAPVAPPPRPESRPDDERDLRDLDAHCDRIVFIPTAETMRAGTMAFSLYELVVLRAAYGISDDFMIDGAVLAIGPFIEDTPYFGDLAVKWNVTRGETLRGALLAGVSAFGDERDSSIALRLMGLAQLCFGTTCQQSLTFAGLLWQLDIDGRSFQIAGFGGGVLARIGGIASILIEPAVMALLSESEDPLPVLSYGVRLGREQWALDITFVRPLVDDASDLPAPGFPLVIFTYRTEGGSTAPAPAPGPSAPMTAIVDRWLGGRM